jgi:hypothetical protein
VSFGAKGGKPKRYASSSVFLNSIHQHRDDDATPVASTTSRVENLLFRFDDGERSRLEGRKHDGPGHGFCIWHGRQHHGPGVPHSSRRVVRCDEWETTKVRIELCLSQVYSPAPMMVAQRWSHLRRAAQRHDRSRSYTSAREPRWTVDRMIQPTAVSAVAKDAFSARQA